MTQELIELRKSILEGRYADALAIVDELDWMSKKATLRQIKYFLVRMLIHLIKNQVEQRLTNSWAASISNSVIEIQDLNLQVNKTSHYIKQNEWQPMLMPAFETAIRQASVEVLKGKYSPFQLVKLVDKTQVMQIAQQLLNLTYEDSAEALHAMVDEYLAQLPGGEDWQEGR